MEMGEEHVTKESPHYYDKLELVYRAYEKSLDLDIALTLVPMNDAEREKMASDSDLQARIEICDAKVRDDLITDLRKIAKCASSEIVRLTAIKELGRTLYPKRFKENGAGTNEMPRSVRYEVVEPLE